MENTKILVVDDDKAIAGAIEKLLVMEGYEVIKAYNGMEALDALVNNDVQLIILDIMMPKMDGLSTMMKVREIKTSPLFFFRRNRRTPIKFSDFQWEPTIMLQNLLIRRNWWQG